MSEKNQADRTRWSRSWIVLGACYGIFLFWYTSFEEPLTEEEIAHFSRVIENSPGGQDRLERWQGFMQNDTGDDFAVWNAIDLFDTPKPAAGARPGESSQQVLDRYSTPFMSKALMRAGHPVMLGFSAGKAIDLWGLEGADDWDQGALVRYRSRRDLLEMFEEIVEEESGIHAFKVAAIEKTVAFPLDPWFQLGDPRLVLAMLFLIIALLLQLRRHRLD
jgi:hypothetical protein